MPRQPKQAANCLFVNIFVSAEAEIVHAHNSIHIHMPTTANLHKLYYCYRCHTVISVDRLNHSISKDRRRTRDLQRALALMKRFGLNGCVRFWLHLYQLTSLALKKKKRIEKRETGKGRKAQRRIREKKGLPSAPNVHSTMF